MSSIVNLDYMRYTYCHRIAVRFVVEKLFVTSDFKTEMLRRVEDHDMDKQMLYLLGVPKKLASNYHRSHSSHHMENNLAKSIYNKLEAVVDYESAGYTKEDKSLNAYDTVMQLKPELTDDLLPILHTLKIDSSYFNTPDDLNYRQFARKYVASNDQELIRMIIKEVIQYTARNPKKAAELVAIADMLKATA